MIYWLLAALAIFCQATYAEHPEKLDPKWFACVSDSQCVIVRGECGWAAANKNFATDAERYFASMMPYVECAEGGYDYPQPSAVCKNNVCTAEEKKSSCGIENCHGLDIVCGPNVPDICTMMYALGDFCREYARCEVVEDKCQLVKEPSFDTCVRCIRECTEDFKNNPVGAFDCEANCRQKVQEKRQSN